MKIVVRAIGGNRVRTAAALAVCTALLVGAVTSSAQAGSVTGGTEAAAAKKKGKKKQKCNSPKRNRVHNALTCTALTRVISNAAPAPPGTERYAFCRNGTYTYSKTDYSSTGSEGAILSYTTTYNGRWRATSSFGTTAGLTGTIEYSVTNFVEHIQRRHGRRGPASRSALPGRLVRTVRRRLHQRLIPLRKGGVLTCASAD